VATVLLRPPRLVRCSIATVGGMPKIASTSGRAAAQLPRVGVQRFRAALFLGEEDKNQACSPRPKRQCMSEAVARNATSMF
jgi:hypothetical protein